MQFWPLANLTKNFFAKNQNNSCSVFGIKQTSTFSSQKNEVVRKKTVWIPRIPFWRSVRKFFHQKSHGNVFKSGNIFWKRRSKNSSLLLDALNAILTILTKVFSQKAKRFLTNFRNYWNNHFFSQKYLNFTVKIFWARILPFWHVWKEFLPKNPKKSLVRFSQTNNGIIFFSHKVFTSSKELIAHAKSSSEKRAEFFAKIRTFVHLEFKIIF